MALIPMRMLAIFCPVTGTCTMAKSIHTRPQGKITRAGAKRDCIPTAAQIQQSVQIGESSSLRIHKETNHLSDFVHTLKYSEMFLQEHFRKNVDPLCALSKPLSTLA
jgi:hypothetical protein